MKKPEQKAKRDDLTARLTATMQNIAMLQQKLDEQQTLRLKLIGAIEYHEELFPSKESK